jgi:hypothetical protein
MYLNLTDFRGGNFQVIASKVFRSVVAMSLSNGCEA